MAVNPIKDIILDLFSDNTNGDITASDMRTFVDGVWADKERKINKYKLLNDAYNDNNLYQLDIFIIVEEPLDSKNGIYVSLINQPNNETEIAQVANLTKNDVTEVQTYQDMINLSAKEGDICTVTDDTQTYVFDGNWKYILSYETIRNAIKDGIISEDTLWSSKKISEFVAEATIHHTHPITDITNLESLLLDLETDVNSKMEDTNGKGSGNYQIFDNNGSSIEILNSPNASANFSKSLKIEPNILSITSSHKTLKITNTILESNISITSNGVESNVISFKAGEAPKTQYTAIHNNDLTNKEYVDTKFDNIPDITNFATIDYVNTQDSYKLNKAGDVMSGALNIIYGANNTGIIIQNTDIMNPFKDWIISNEITDSFSIRKRDNYQLLDVGISITDNASLLELDTDIYYNNLKIATEEYVNDRNILQDLVIATKVSKNGDTMSGKLIAKGLETSLGSSIRLQEFQYSNSPSIEFLSMRYDSFGVQVPGMNNPSIVFNIEDELGNDNPVLKMDLVVKSEGQYQKIWNSGNDGIDSGLDADKLDGMEPEDLPINTDTIIELDKKYDKTGGIISGNVDVQGNIYVNDISSQNILSNILSVSGITSLNVTTINDNVSVNNNKDLTVTGSTYLKNLDVSAVPEFHDNIIIGKSINDNPKIIFHDNNSTQEISITYDKSEDELKFSNNTFADSMIYHENNLDVYEKSEHIDNSTGPADGLKPIVLNASGKIDPSMLDVSVFYYVGSWTPTPSDEYPDTTNEQYGAFWDVTGVPTSGYTFTGGDLAGTTINNADFLVHAVGGWSIMVSEMNPMLYYKLDGSSPITDNFQGGGHRITNIADGSMDSDAVTIGQMSTFASVFYARDGSLPLTNNFQGAGYKITDISDGTNDTDGATLRQVNRKFNKDGSEIFKGNLRVGDGTIGDSIILRGINNYNSPNLDFNRKDDGNIFKIYSDNETDITFAFFDPDNNPGTPVSEYVFNRNGNLNIQGTLHVEKYIEALNNISTEGTLHTGNNVNNNSVISFNYNSPYGQSNIYFDNISKTFKIDETPAEEGYVIWHSGNLDRDD